MKAGPSVISVILLITLVLLTSGCVQTGEVTAGEGQGLTPEEELVLEGFLNEAQGPCGGLECPDSVTACHDGFTARCGNTCANGTCTRCTPDCSGHEAEEASCPECGACQVSGPLGCSCDLVVPCSGNGICEYGEYPGQDCPSCDDSDPCTLDSYAYSSRLCIHEILVPCCGDRECGEDEDFSSCPDDCGEISGVRITNLDPIGEWLEIRNLGSADTDMTGWIIRDALAEPREVFRFPEFALGPGRFVYILKGYGEDNDTHLHRNRNNNVWNNEGDTAVLIDSMGRTVSEYGY